MRLLNAADVRRTLPMPRAIEAMKRAFGGLSSGKAVIPNRAHLPLPRRDGVTLVMPAFVDSEQGEALAVKVISLFGGNPGRGLPRIQAIVVLLDPQTGRPVGLLEGATLTAIRTGAASGAATDLLARPDSRTVAILGAAVQARTQLEAVCTVRSIRGVRVYDPLPGRVEGFISEVAGQGPIPADIRPAASADEAVASADIVCTATTADRPVFSDAALKGGVHINAIGSYQSGVREIPAETVARSLVFVDGREAALSEAGDLIQPIREGRITAGHIRGELGELVLGRKTGRTSPEQITLFKSVGVAVQDAVAAQEALGRAEQLGLGQVISW